MFDTFKYARLAGIDELRLQHQLYLEELFNKNQTLKRVRQEFTDCPEFDFAAYMKAHGIPEDFGFDLLVQMALHKRTSLPTMVGILRRHFALDDDDEQASQETADMIYKAAAVDLVDWSPVSQQLIVRFTVSEDVQRDLDRYQYPLPFVVPPLPVRNNRDTGYYVMQHASIILRDNHHENDVCLDHINRVNRVRFTLNQDTALMVRNQWRNLDKPKPGESEQDFEKRKRAFDKYDRTAKEVIELVVRYGNEFFLTHRYDKRGRTYCQGYHVNYQGASWNKAVVELADKEIVS